MNRHNVEQLYEEVYRLTDDLVRAEYSIEIENLEKEIVFLEEVIWNLEQEEIRI